MNPNFAELQKQILALLVAAGKDVLGDIEADFRAYAKNLAAWATEAVQTGNMKLLKSVEGQVKLLAARNTIKVQKRLMVAMTNILEVAMTAGFALLKGMLPS